jgi:Carbohydrate esterase, sialic acid-specific acetylesterase
MAQNKIHRIFCTIAALAFAGNAYAGDKPLKVYIMAGQSNMQGKAEVRTIERMKLAGGNPEMYQNMMSQDGKLIAPKGVHGVYITGGDMTKGEARPINEIKGPSKPGFVEAPEETQTFGPEYAFGIYMQKHLNEPILIIKTAWGGRNLLQQFRSPSAGPYEKDKDNHGNPTGAYYQLIIKNVKNTLENLGNYHPDYDPAKGYEIAGFVWFQGFNDLIGPYPDGDFSEYSKLLAHLIRDIRKDLNVPSMPVVVGVMGIGGPIENKADKQYKFREAQAAVADMSEFKGNVTAVRTAHLWDMELERIQEKLETTIAQKIKAEDPNIKEKTLSKAVKDRAKKERATILTPEELKIMETGISDQQFHYMGSAMIYSNIGKAFADAMHVLSPKK